MEQNDINKVTVNKNDEVAIGALIVGLISVFFSSIGIIPLCAIGLGIWGIFRTQEVGTGRWMAVVGLLSGTLFLFMNAQMNGHIGSSGSSMQNNINTQNRLINNTESTKPMPRITTEVVDFTKTEYQNEFGGVGRRYTFSIKFTNETDQTIAAFKTRLCIDTLFNAVLCDNYVEKYDPILSGNSVTYDFTYDNMKDMQKFFGSGSLGNVEDASSLKATLNNLEIVHKG